MAEANRYWLIGPSAEVRNYSYDFNFHDWKSGEIEKEVINVKRAGKADSKQRQGITYDSILHKLIDNPSIAITRKIQRNEQTIQLDFVFKDYVKVTCGNGISHSWRGYFEGWLKVGSLWLDAKKMVPLKLKSGWNVEYFSEYVAAGEGRYVPLKITIGKDDNRYQWMFGFYDPGLWLLEKAHYGYDEQGKPYLAASINNLKINRQAAVKTESDAVEVPEIKDGREVKGDKASPQRKSVTLALTDQGMIFEGQAVTWEQFPSLLADVPDPENTGVRLLLKSDSLSSEYLNNMKTRISILSRELGFRYLTSIEKSTGKAQNGAEQFSFTAPLKFNKDIYIRQSAAAEFKQTNYRTETGWHKDESGQHKVPATIYAYRITFRKTLLKGNVAANLRIPYRSWPKAKWFVTVRLLNDNGKELAQDSRALDTGGMILSGNVMSVAGEMDFSLGNDAKLYKAACFELVVVPVVEDKAAAGVDNKILAPASINEGTRKLEKSGVTEIVETSDGRAKVIYLAGHVYCADLGKLAVEKIGFVADKDVTFDEGKNQISIVCPTRGDAERVAEFLQEVDVEPVQVDINVRVVEAYADAKLDWETRREARRIVRTKLETGRSGPSYSAADILKEISNTEPKAENGLEKLVDLLVSKGFSKILMMPRLRVVDGKTARIQTSSKEPDGNDVTTSFEITPQLLGDGSIDVAARMVYRNKQMGDPQTRINIKDGVSRIIASMTKTEKLAGENGAKAPQERTTEIMVILTPTIRMPATNSSNKAAVPVEADDAGGGISSVTIAGAPKFAKNVKLLAVSNLQWQYAWQDKHGIESKDEWKPGYWWKPDGARIENVDFRRARFSLSDARQFDFLVQVDGLEDYNITASHAGSTNTSLNRVHVSAVFDKEGQIIPNRHVLSVPDFPHPPEQTSLRIGLATGQWEDVDSWTYQWAAHEPQDIIAGSKRAGLVYTWPRQDGSDVTLEVNHTYTVFATRLVAIDRDDKTHTATMRSGGEGVRLTRQICRFKDLDRGQIKTIKFQKRPFEWVEFPNVVLGPDHISGILTRKASAAHVEVKGRVTGPGAEETEKLDIETLLGKVRKALQPSDDMRVTWRFE
ncbi:MAG: hypothetical protein ACYS8Z_21495, partial [Planctomycetota bacterium]